MARARTDTRQISTDLLQDLSVLRNHLDATGNEKVREAWAGVETFCAIALRVFAKTNPSKIKDEAMTVEISYRLRELEKTK